MMSFLTVKSLKNLWCKKSVTLYIYRQSLATNCSNKLICVKNGMCIVYDYLSKLNPTNPS